MNRFNFKAWVSRMSKAIRTTVGPRKQQILDRIIVHQRALTKTKAKAKERLLPQTKPSTMYYNVAHFLRYVKNHRNVKETVRFGILFTGAEFTQQLISRKIITDKFEWRTAEKREAFDFDSMFHYSIWGFAIFPHTLRIWYRFLERKYPGSAVRNVVSKTVVDQTFFPLPILSSFYIFLSFLEGKTESWSQLTEECRVKLQTTLAARYAFMIPAQALNFAFMPPKHRVIYVGVSTFFWLNILCVLKRLDMSSDIFKFNPLTLIGFDETHAVKKGEGM